MCYNNTTALKFNGEESSMAETSQPTDTTTKGISEADFREFQRWSSEQTSQQEDPKLLGAQKKTAESKPDSTPDKRQMEEIAQRVAGILKEPEKTKKAGDTDDQAEDTKKDVDKAKDGKGSAQTDTQGKANNKNKPEPTTFLADTPGKDHSLLSFVAKEKLSQEDIGLLHEAQKLILRGINAGQEGAPLRDESWADVSPELFTTMVLKTNDKFLEQIIPFVERHKIKDQEVLALDWKGMARKALTEELIRKVVGRVDLDFKTKKLTHSPQHKQKLELQAKAQENKKINNAEGNTTQARVA